MEEFTDICHKVACHDLTLMEDFSCGLDEDIHFLMPRSNPWSRRASIGGSGGAAMGIQAEKKPRQRATKNPRGAGR